MVRLATAAVLLVLVVGGIIFLPAAVSAAVLGVFLIGAGWEWSGLIGWTHRGLRVAYAVFLALMALAIWRWNEYAAAFSYIQLVAILWWSMAAILVIAAQLRRLGKFIGVASNGATGLVVLLPAWSAIVWLLNNDRTMLLSVFALIWVADAAAFFVGKRWGSRRLASNVSPGKTWEGVAGGLACGALCAVIISHAVVFSDGARVAFIALAMITIGASIIGDLFESMVKRHIGVKDSGRILPGHGGVLDRIDALVAAAPVFAAGLYYWVNRI